MKALWLHGMTGSPDQEKIAWMESKGFETHALHINYLQEPRRFEILRDYCEEHQIEFLVGFSFGGFLGFWLSEELSLPCLLLNPAVSLRGKEKTKPNISNLKSPLCMVGLGDQDEAVDHTRTLLFMERDQREGKTILTRVIAGEKHGFSRQAFEVLLDWAMENLRKHGYLNS